MQIKLISRVFEKDSIKNIINLRREYEYFIII